MGEDDKVTKEFEFRDSRAEGQLREVVEIVGRMANRHIDMLCAAFTVKHGVAPTIVHVQGAAQSYAQMPGAHEQATTVEQMRGKLGADLDILAARYRANTDIEPEDAVVTMRWEPEGGTVEVLYLRRKEAPIVTDLPNVEFLCLGDTDLPTELRARAWLFDEWKAKPEELVPFDVLIVLVRSWDYEEVAWMLLRDRATGKLYENTGSHCSCSGFEDQFLPAPSSAEYLLSDKFSLTSLNKYKPAVREYVRRNLVPR